MVVADREADIFEYFQAERAANVDLLVRVYEPRQVDVQATGRRCALPDAGHALQDYGSTQVRIERQNREVELTLRLQVGRVDVYPPQSWPAATPGLALVIATEVGCRNCKTQADCFDPKQPAAVLLSPTEVQLLSTVSARPVQSVREVVLALGKLVGFAPSEKQPLPGVKVLATALERFFFIKLGAQAQASSKSLQD